MVFLLIMVTTGWVVVQSTWLKRELDGIFKRVHFSRERAFKGERAFSGERGIQERRERNSRERGEVCPGYLNSAFRHLPNGCLDQLDPMLALGAALFLHPINKSTCHGQSHCPNFTFSCKVSFWMWFL